MELSQKVQGLGKHPAVAASLPCRYVADLLDPVVFAVPLELARFRGGTTVTFGARNRTRTCNLRITNQLHCQLCYPGIECLGQ